MRQLHIEAMLRLHRICESADSRRSLLTAIDLNMIGGVDLPEQFYVHCIEQLLTIEGLPDRQSNIEQVSEDELATWAFPLKLFSLIFHRYSMRLF